MNEAKFNELLKGVLAELSDEQKAKAAACRDPKEFIALLGEMGVALPDELLEGAAGGYIWTMPHIGATDIGASSAPIVPQGGAENPGAFTPPTTGGVKIF